MDKLLKVIDSKFLSIKYSIDPLSPREFWKFMNHLTELQLFPDS